MKDTKSKKILEVGCGLKPFKEEKGKVIHLDKIKLPHVEIVHDLDKFPYSFKDNEFDMIIASHVLEHVEDLVAVMKEFHRILKKDGILKITVPYFASPTGFMDPTHKHFFTLKTFDYWDKRTFLGKKFNYEVNNVEFKIIKKELHFGKIKITIKNSKVWSIYENVFSKIIPASEIYFELKKL
ncbi:MAG: class I SAM-dependent methyltransferase [Candidatus Aenigmatarchaeota archaeon]